MTILEEILDTTRDLVASRKRKRSASALTEEESYGRAPLSLRDALCADPLTFIAELKKASPSKGVIRQDFDVVKLAEAYEENGAAALSVLTEPFFFQGSLDYLASVRMHVGIPLLRKDFVIDAYQLYEARAYGADAVLLIAAALDPFHLEDLYLEAFDVGLECLVEVHSVEELESIRPPASIIGVNNRNLHTFEVDLTHCLRVFEHAGPEPVRVAESGIRTADDLMLLADGGIRSVLIGETFMRAKNPGDKLRELREGALERLT
jgi:indole-3-glycerol phosphate synthase